MTVVGASFSLSHQCGGGNRSEGSSFLHPQEQLNLIACHLQEAEEAMSGRPDNEPA